MRWKTNSTIYIITIVKMALYNNLKIWLCLPSFLKKLWSTLALCKLLQLGFGRVVSQNIAQTTPEMVLEDLSVIEALYADLKQIWVQWLCWVLDLHLQLVRYSSYALFIYLRLQSSSSFVKGKPYISWNWLNPERLTRLAHPEWLIRTGSRQRAHFLYFVFLYDSTILLYYYITIYKYGTIYL